MKFCFIYLLQLYLDIRPRPLCVLMHVGLNYNITCPSIDSDLWYGNWGSYGSDYVDYCLVSLIM